MESDERFKHLASDPRFKVLRKKQRKVQIDDRFQSMFTDEKFTLKYSKDKRGRNQKKSSGDDLKKYYSLEEEQEKRVDKAKPIKRSKESEKVPIEDDKEDSEDEESTDIEEEQKDIEDEETEEQDSNNDIEEENEDEEKELKDEEETVSELSSSSDESESEPEDEAESGAEDGLDINKVEYDWQPLDHDAETAETTTNRLAIQNLDWDHLDVKDIYTLVHSVRPPISVKIYISEFGRERMKREEIEGPKELVEMPKVDEEEEEYNQLRDKMRALKNLEPKTYKINEYEDADEGLDLKNEEIRERIRAYQLNRMKYYYAVAEFDSVESAEVVYKELDGMEYEGSSLELDLRFIPDDIEFNEEDVKSVCDKVPDLTNYSAPNFINTALQQTTAKFTWDETDIKRQEKLRKAHTKEELEKDDLEAYLGSDSDSEDEEEPTDGAMFDDSVSVVTANSEARINKYKMLLKSLEEETEKKKKVDIDVEWENESEDEEEQRDKGRSKIGGNKSDEEEIVDSDVWSGSDNGSGLDQDDEDIEDEEVESKKEKKERKKKKPTSKSAKRRNKKLLKDGKESDDEDELDLLVMDVNKTKREEFKFNPEDERFNAVYESGRYNIDPSHPNFKRTQAFDTIAEKKREKRQKTSS